MREQAQSAAAAAGLKAVADAEEKQRTEFVQQAAKLHHLVGTRAQPGVLMSPAQVLMGTMPTFDGSPVEDHLRLLCHHTVRSFYAMSPSRLHTRRMPCLHS